ncbi:hypothetical protein [Winogradskyella sp.]|jgi:hypothetical protein|uniref:hypothetical protein n=1 Tax=Winogradskyella sp. TaxID=1883156 RepID=UPI0025E00994|nr:hypothetical protein [Winogradskyella sp.]MCT4629774.1 hypothetical protein [Winogradskyella sp.]
MKQNKETIKSYFETGDKPTQNQYHDTWDSFWHKDEVISVNHLETKNLQQITDQGNSTTNDIEMIGGNLTITDGDTPSNPFSGNLNISYTDDKSGNVFSIYNAITKTKSSSNEFLYGINNLMYHNAADDIGHVYGAFNRARTLGSGVPVEVVGMYNQSSYRNTGSGSTNLLSGSENYVNVEDFGGSGTIANTIGIRGKVIHKNPNVTSSNVYNGFFGLDLESGTVDNWTGVSIDLNQTGGTVNSGEYLKLDNGVQLPNPNMKAINSLVDLPSYFKGIIESDVTNDQINGANAKVLPTKEWVEANSISKFSSTIGDGSATTISVNHNLGSEDVIIQVRDTNTKTIVDVTIAIVDINTINLTFNSSPIQDQYRVVVMA